MRQNMRRTLGILLGLTLALGLMLGLSITALADGVYNTYLVTATDDDDTLQNKAVSFNGIEWYIIKDDSKATNDGTVTLLAKECLGESKFGSDHTYRGSAVETWLSTYYSQNFSSVDSAVISVTPSKPDGWAAKLYLLSVDEIRSLPILPITFEGEEPKATYLKCQQYGKNVYWWLRSPSVNDDETQGIVGGAAKVDCRDGQVDSNGDDVTWILGVRPALQLKLSSVVFIKELKTFLLPQTISASDVTVTYGDTDKKITAKTTGDGAISYAVKAGSEDYINVDAFTGMLTILKAGTATVTVTTAKTDVCVEATKDVTVTINKAEPTANAPVASAIYGQTLANVALENPDGNTEGSWTWMNNSASVGNVGSRVFKAQFTPNDTTNYNGKKNVYVTVIVEKAQNPATVVGTATVRRGGNTVDLADNVDLKSATGAVRYAISGSRNGCKLNGSELTSGDKTGSLTVNVIVAADDNYMALPATPITVTISDKSVQTITAADVTATYGDTDKEITASTTGDGAISYTVKNDSKDYIDVDATTGALTIKKVPADGKACVTVTAAETLAYNKATADVTVTINKADNPAKIEGTATVRRGGNAVDLADNVTLNGATGAVSYEIIGDAKGCSLNGSVLTSGDEAGTVTVNIAVAADDNYNALPATPVTVTVGDRNAQTITAADVTATYGDTDKKITASTTGDGAISYAVKQGSEDYIAVDASSGTLTIRKVPADGKACVTVTAAATANCESAAKDVTVTINKAEPTANAPVASAIYGQTLANVALENPDGNTEGSWTWMNNSASVGNVGSRVFKAQFTPNDTTNYNGKKNVYVTVIVEKAQNPATVVGTATVRRGGNTVDLADNVDLKSATGAVRYAISGSRNGCKLNGSELTSGDKTGSLTVNVIVAADDNYMALPATPITVTISDKSVQTITAADVTATYGDTDKEITASTTGDGAISYTVKNDSVDYIDVDATTGALTVKKVPVDGKAYVTVTAAETPTYVKATKDVTIYIGKAKAVASTVTANSPKYNATAQPLVTVDESTLVGGKMVYAVTKDKKAPEASAYTEKIPEKKSAGAYYVWYKAVGDADHADSDAARLKVIVYQRGIGDCKITVKDLSYTGKTLKPKVTVKYGKTTLKEGRDYKLTYSNKLINPGEWHMKVVGLGNFKSSKKLAFKVYLPKIKNVSLTSGNTEIVVKWSQKAKIKHCQIQVSQKKDFSSKKSVKFTISEKNEKHTKTVKGLQPDMKYYVRVRTYKTVGKKTYYSAWSEVKTVKTKTSTKNNAQARPVEMIVGEVLDLNTLLSQEEIEAVRSWSSDGTETAAVSPEGVVTAMQPGEAAVTAILEDDETIEFTITVREDGIVLLDLGEGDLMIDLDEDVLGDMLGDLETSFEIGEM